LTVGLLLVAFPPAHGVILTALYIPVFLMLIGLILRGVSFEFRAKVKTDNKIYWNISFFIGSLLTSLSQGFMLGMYIMGLEYTTSSVLFSIFTSFCLTGAYLYIGSAWLILKTEGRLLQKATKWAKNSLFVMLSGFVGISIITPLVNERIFYKWFSVPEILMLFPIPMTVFVMAIISYWSLKSIKNGFFKLSWIPFISGSFMFILAFIGLAYSFYPYIVPDMLLIEESTISNSSLLIILFGALFVVPIIAGYSVLSYWIFRGKSQVLSYD
jgi:cytochrome d ubiquinol oxidase subunit II